MHARRMWTSILLVILVAVYGLNAETVISVEDTVVRDNVMRLGINLGSRSQWGASVCLLKNLIPNPGFEAAEMGQVILSTDSSTATEFQQDFWDNNTNGIGQPEGFWDGASYDIVYGPADGNSGAIQQFHFTAEGAAERPTFQLDKSVPVPNEHDALIVRKRFSCSELASFGSGTGGMSRSGNISYDTGDTRPGSPGEQCIVLGADAELKHYMDSAYRDGDQSSGKLLIVVGDWRVSFWAKPENAGDRVRVRFFREAGEATFIDETVTLSTGWQEVVRDFTVAPGEDPDREYDAAEYHPIVGFWIQTSGLENTGSVRLDDVYLGRRDETNPTVFSDNVVNRLREYNPGVLRAWGGQLGASLEEETDPMFGRRCRGYRIGSKSPTGFTYSLPEFLELCAEVGAQPWYVMPPSMSGQEFRDLVDFLAGPTGTVYGAKRASLGRSAPWTDAFDRILLEFGNELWGGGDPGDPFGGASLRGGVRLGHVADKRFAAMRSNPNFSSKLRLVIGGQAGYPGRQSEIETNSDSHDITALAPYYYGSFSNYADYEDIYGPLYAMPLEKATVGNTSQCVDNIVAGGNGTVPAIYEINFHTTGVEPTESVRNETVTGIGGGLSLALFMLTYIRELGIREQCAFSLLQYSFTYDWGPAKYVRLWGMLRDTERVATKRPTWLSCELANRVIYFNMITTTHSGDDPTWLQPAVNGLSAETEAPYIQSFAFRDGQDYSLIIFNLHRSSALDARLDLPGIPAPNATMHRLASAHLTDDNEQAENVTISTTSIGDFADNYQVSLPPFSLTAFEWSTTIDTAAPTISLDTLDLGGTVTDQQPVPYVMVDGAQAAVSGGDWNVPGLSLQPGVPMSVQASDSSGNSREVRVTLSY